MTRAILAVLALSGCTLTLDHAAAMSNEFMADQPITDDLDVEVTRVVERLEAAGFTVVERTPEALEGLEGGDLSWTVRRLLVRSLDEGRAMTIPREVWVPAGFWNWPTSKILMLLRHEERHVGQWGKLGVLLFGLSYADYAKVWHFEMHGDRQTIRDLVDLKFPEAELLEHVERRALAFPAKYKFPRRHHAAVTQATREVLTLEYRTYVAARRPV